MIELPTERLCVRCGIPLQKRPKYSVKQWEGVKFCSRRCAGKHKEPTWKKGQCGNPLRKNIPPKPGAVVACAVCGKEFYRSPSAIKAVTESFCSRTCSWKSPGVRSRISASNMGKTISEETREKLRKSHQQYLFPIKSRWERAVSKHPCPDCGKSISETSKHCGSCKCKYWTPKHRRAIADGTSKKLRGKMPANMNREGKFRNVKRGWFDIGGKRIFLRSKWEANYALYLDFLKTQAQISTWEYEAEVFFFDGIRSGTTSYRPDFKVTLPSGMVEYHEVKGWFTPKSKTQLKRMAKYHPKTVLKIVDRKLYAEICNKLGAVLKFF